jgi:DNA replication protein DnaC
MLTHPTLDLLHELGLHGMAKGFKALEQAPDSKSLDHAEWLGLLLEHEVTLRRQKRFEARARTAQLRHNASIEDVDYRAARGLERAMFLKLAGCDFIREHRNLLITGPCGVGKSWLACALGHKACREDFSVRYHRMPRLFAALALARGDGRYAKLLRTLPASISSSSTIGGRNSSMPGSAATSWRSSRTAATLARSSSPASCRSSAGTRSSASRRSPMPSSIASFTAPTG